MNLFITNKTKSKSVRTGFDKLKCIFCRGICIIHVQKNVLFCFFMTSHSWQKLGLMINEMNIACVIEPFEQYIIALVIFNFPSKKKNVFD